MSHTITQRLSTKPMQGQYLILSLSILFCALSLQGQNKQVDQLIFPLLPVEYQSNIIVTADPDHPLPCPPGYTNLLSNAELFSVAEQKKLAEITLKYKNVTTNSGPAGTVSSGLALRQREAVQLTSTSTWIEATNTFWVATFAYTNSGATEEIAVFPGHEMDACFRTQTGDGYDVLLYDGLIVKYQAYKSGFLDGLFVEIYDPNNPTGQQHCTSWARFTQGKIVGKYIMWQDGQIEAMAEFQKPFDFLRYQTQKTDLSWTEVPSNAQKPTESQK